MSARRKPGSGAVRGFIFRTTIRLKNGRVLKAADYGKKAFKIPVGRMKRKPR